MFKFVQLASKYSFLDHFNLPLMKKRLITPLLFLFSLASDAQNSDSILIKKIADEILINGVAYENLRYLCKQIGPRLSGSANAQKAVLATAKMLRDAGADTVYLQPCMCRVGSGEKRSLAILKQTIIKNSSCTCVH